LGWKEGFPEHAEMYRKCDRYKEAMRDYFKEEAKQEMKQMLVEIMTNPDSEIRQQLASVMSSQSAHNATATDDHTYATDADGHHATLGFSNSSK
jgi:hypothetical protein